MIYNGSYDNVLFFLNTIFLLYLSYILINEKELYIKVKRGYSNLENYILELSKPYLETFLKYSSYEYDNLITNENEDNIEIEDKKVFEKEDEKYENKYLRQYKELVNEYSFTEEESKFEIDQYDMLVSNKINSIEQRNQELNNKLTNVVIISDRGEVGGNDNIKEIINYHNLDIENDTDDDSDDEQETYNLNELFIKLLDKESEYRKELKELEETEINYEDLKKEAYDLLMKRHLERLINNYIIEYSPLGNVVMRYNELKGSFEYFSNNTIPYRYLEAIGRKYVITFKCKPLFIDLEEELKKGKIEDVNNSNSNSNSNKNMLVQLNKSLNNMPMKNRNENNLINMKGININDSNSNKKQILKEKSNRYTWEGRLTNFNPLKKIDRKIVDKKYGLSYADFKRMKLTNNK
jgi:hypothetical protein